MDIKVNVECNWSRTSGCALSKVVQTKVTHEDIFIKPELDEILGEEQAILLSRPADGAQCEMQLRLLPSCYKIDSFSFISSAEKIELFTGPQKEYMETSYGFKMASEDDSPEETIKMYRYDIEVEKSGVVELTIKMLTSSDEICIYGTLLQAAPNPNGITTLLPNSTINLDNVQQMLNNSNQKLSPNAEKCKLFMEIYNKNAMSSQSNKLTMELLEQMKLASTSKTLPPPASGNNFEGNNTTEYSNWENNLKAHIDMRVHELQTRITARLDVFEMQQRSKLDKILQILTDK